MSQQIVKVKFGTKKLLGDISNHVVAPSILKISCKILRKLVGKFLLPFISEHEGRKMFLLELLG